MATHVFGGDGSTVPSKVTVEVRSVNAKYLEPRVKQPFGVEVEKRIRDRIRSRFGRGRIEVLVTWVPAPVEGAGGLLTPLGIDEERLREVAASVAEVQRIAHQEGLELSQPTALELLRFLGGSRSSVSAPELGVSPEPQALVDVVDQALTAMLALRETEGQALHSELQTHLQSLGQSLVGLRQCIAREQQRLTEVAGSRIRELSAQLAAGEVDAQRITQEVALLLVRADVAEEVSRIESHVDQFSSVLQHEPSSGQGRTLDFLCQELFREVTTIGSKISSHEAVPLVIAAKSTVERMREQVQNVE